MEARTVAERYAWILFALVALAGLLPGLPTLVRPQQMASIFEGFGHAVPAAIATDPAAMEYLRFAYAWTSTMVVGFDLMALFIAVFAFRKGARWAWYAFWFWPVMFVHHFAHYEGPFRYAQLVWAAMATAALLGTIRMTRPPDAHRTSVATTAATNLTHSGKLVS